MAALTLKAINDELAGRGYSARLVKANGYVYSRRRSGGWLDRTVGLRARSIA